jgi:hypothetical protein
MAQRKASATGPAPRGVMKPRVNIDDPVIWSAPPKPPTKGKKRSAKPRKTRPTQATKRQMRRAGPMRASMRSRAR